MLALFSAIRALWTDDGMPPGCRPARQAPIVRWWRKRREARAFAARIRREAREQYHS